VPPAVTLSVGSLHLVLVPVLVSCALSLSLYEQRLTQRGQSNKTTGDPDWSSRYEASGDTAVRREARERRDEERDEEERGEEGKR